MRIGNAAGFWGDSVDAPAALIRAERLDYLTLEYLAELTMSILALQKAKDPSAGFASDFISVLNQIAPDLEKQPQLKIVTNAGGMNPAACAAKARAMLGAKRKLAVVTGDDLLPKLDDLIKSGHPLINLDTKAPFSDIRSKVVSANAYLGAKPIADALVAGADIVITGRVADAALTLGPCVKEFGWKWEDWDRLCAGIVAGHLLECGAQATGGLWINWQETDLANVGYPIADMNADGSFTMTKPANTGGAVNIETVGEQLLYEVGDPARYLTPDVVADFTTLSLTQAGKDAVLLRNCKGKPATDSYKVSIAYRDGFAVSGMLVIAGPGAAEKARNAGEMILSRLERVGAKPQHSLIECLGAGDSLHGVLPKVDAPEVVLRVSARDPDKAKLDRFAKEFAPLVTSGPPGVTGYTTGRPQVREVFAYWPTLLAKEAVTPEWKVLD
ncbi:MAG: acyclic terpene utilization AtuA family protein [Gemmataceae bacterium]